MGFNESFIATDPFSIAADSLAPENSNYITVSDISRLLKAENKKIPERYISLVTGDPDYITMDCAFVVTETEQKNAVRLADYAVSKGAAIIISTFQIKNYPCLIVPNTTDALCQLAVYFKAQFDIKTIGVTGGKWKTITKEMIWLVLSKELNAVKSAGATNNVNSASNTILSVNENTDAIVLSIGMNSKGSVSHISKLARLRVAVITNVTKPDIPSISTPSEALKENLTVCDGLDDDGFAAMNSDDMLLRNCQPKCGYKVTYGIKDEKADFRAINLSEDKGITKFIIYHDGVKTPVILKCTGVQYIYAALAAFTVGTLLEIPAQSIARSLMQFKPVEVRKNIKHFGEVTVISESFSDKKCTLDEEMMLLCKSEIKNGGKRIAVFGDLSTNGETAVTQHKKFGEILNSVNIDCVICCGEYARYIAAGINPPKTVVVTMNEPEAVDALWHYIKPNDIVLFRGSDELQITALLEYGLKLKEYTPPAVVDEKDVFIDTITCRSFVLADMKSDEIYIEKNIDEKVQPSGILRILLAILAIERSRPSKAVTITEEMLTSAGADLSARVGFVAGENVTLKDVLILLLLVSGNDVANAVAISVFGSISNAVTEMNGKAKEIGAADCCFINANGIDAEGQYVTVRDMLVITRYAMKNPVFREIVKLPKYTLNPTNMCDEERVFISKNNMLRKNRGGQYYEYCTGVNASRTERADNCLVATASKNGSQLCAIIMGSPRIDNQNVTFSDAKRLFEYGFDNKQQ